MCVLGNIDILLLFLNGLQTLKPLTQYFHNFLLRFLVNFLKETKIFFRTTHPQSTTNLKTTPPQSTENPEKKP